MTRRWTRLAGRPVRVRVVLLALAVLACSPGATPPSRSGAEPSRTAAEPPQPSPEPDRGAAAFPGRVWGWVEAPEAGLRFLLPDRAGWRMTMTRGFLRATHGRADARVLARAWRSDSVVNRDDCEATARQTVPSLAQLAKHEVFAVDESRLPEPYDTRVRFGMHVVGAARVRGIMLAFGANMRQCLAMEVVVSAEGPRARLLVAERLGYLSSRLPASAQILGVADRLGQRP